MIIYSVTIGIDNTVRDEWVSWMLAKHIPQVMASGCFVDFRFLRVLDEEDKGGTSYNAQYRALSMDQYLDYRDNYAPALQADMAGKYSNQYVAFRTLLETVE